jgi:organic hydroperoxide reductase OsmC/OhrA
MTEPLKVTLTQRQDYQFEIAFTEGAPTLLADEPPPLGGGRGPGPAQMLVAAVANCLSDSLLFALRKFGQAAEPITTSASGTVGRNEKGRMRVQGIAVDIRLGQPAGGLEHMDRILGQFEDFCTVTQSVRTAIEVQVNIFDSTGARLK